MDSYKGYKEAILTDDEMAMLYEKLSHNAFGCLTNEYLVVKNANNEIVDKLKWDGAEYRPLSYRTIKNDHIGIVKPRNLQQELAFDLLQDHNIPVKILTGCFGSGKDFLMISNALSIVIANTYRSSTNGPTRILWVRNNVEVKDSKAIGFLPGGVFDKLLPFTMVIADHVGGREGVERLMDDGMLEVEHLGFMRGRDIKNAIIICTEAENMTKQHIQLLLGRVGEGSMLWLNGDFKQVDAEVFRKNSGLMASVEKLKGHKLFGCVDLCKTERSETAAMADLLD